MQVGEVFFFKPPPLAQRNRQRIPQRQHGSRRSRRSQPQRASLLRDRTIQRHIRRCRQSRNLQRGRQGHERGRFTRAFSANLIPGHRNQRHPQPLDGRQQLQNLFRLTACRERQHHIAAHHHAQIPMHRIHRVQIQRRCPGGTERRRNLARNQPALAHAGHHHAPRATKQQLHGALKRLRHGAPNPVRQRAQGLRLNAHHVLASMFHG